MCGIAGVRRFGGEPITPVQIKVLACALEHRGNHATGVALMQGNEIQVLKDDIPAWQFVARKDFKEFLEQHLSERTEAVLIHTRAATQGDPEDNVNNHPLYVGKSAVVHNGMVWNDADLFREMKLKREGAVDSDVLRAILDENGFTKKGLRELGKIRGSAAIAAVSTEYPGKLLLARSGSPLVLASTPDQLVWASEKGAIHQACRPWLKRFGVMFQPNRSDMAFITLNDNSAWLFGPDGLEWHEEFNPCKNYNRPTYNVHNNYSIRRWKRDEKTPDMVACVGCHKIQSIPEHLAKEPLWELQCYSCKQAIAEPPTN